MAGFDYHIPEMFEEHLGSIARHLDPLLTPERREKLRSSLTSRQRKVLCVFENTHHCHNISAMLRTLDAMGFMESLFVYHEPLMRFRQRDSVERGSSQWLLTRRVKNVTDTALALKSAGYCIGLVSLPSFSRTSESFQGNLIQFEADSLSNQNSQDFKNLLAGRPLALVFGSELKGVSPEWTRLADLYLSVRMQGFVESLNVSVCAGILLHGLRQHFAVLGDRKTHLSSREQTMIHEYWLARSVKNAKRTIEASSKDLGGYFDFMCSGKFFDPFI